MINLFYESFFSFYLFLFSFNLDKREIQKEESIIKVIILSGYKFNEKNELKLFKLLS